MDIRSDNPVGRVPDSGMMRRGTVELGARCRIGRRSLAWAGASDRALSGLDSLHALEVTGSPPAESSAAAAQLLHRAAARGTYVHGLSDDAVRAALDPALAAHIPAGRDEGTVGELAWDIRAVEQRRAAIRPLLGRLPSMSAVLPSRRPELVAQMVAQVAAMHYDELEIVVALHGCPPPPGLTEAAAGRPLVVLEFDADTIFGEVLNHACAAASGELICKVDDDDYFAPEHLWDLAAAHCYSGATLVGKMTTVVHLEALDTTVRRVYGARESFTHRVAGSTMTIAAADLRAVGGWSPVPRAVDTALLRSVAEHQGTVYQPHDIGYIYVRRSDPNAHTWPAQTVHFLRNVREQWIGLLHHPAFGTASVLDSPDP
ncbi:glycosyltransferase [Ruania alba]|nr:glycosyltransferase [Ruania alba]